MTPDSSAVRALCKVTLSALLLASLGACQRASTSPALFADAQQYRQKKQPKAAIIQLKNLLQQDPNHADARLSLGQLYLEMGDAVSAEKELRRAQALGTRSPDLWASLGQALLMQGQFQKLLDTLSAAPGIADQEALIALRANAYLGLAQLGKAQVLFERLRATRPQSAEALLGLAKIAAASHQADSASALVEQILKANPADIDALRFSADLMRNRGEDDEARQIYRRILTLQPDDARSHVDVANLAIQTGQLKQAHIALAAARNSAPNGVMVAQTQALLDFREGKLKPALEGLQRILRDVPDYMPALLLSGAVELSIGSNQQAAQHLERYLAANPFHPYASKMLAVIALKDNKPEVANKLLAPLLETDKNDSELLALRGETAMRTKQFNVAADYFKMASVLTPENGALHTAIAFARQAQGNDIQMIAELEMASSLEKNDITAGTLLVMTYLHNKDGERALATLQKMELAQPNNPAVRNLKGGVLIARHDFPAARAAFSQALVLAPNYVPAIENLAQLDVLDKKPEQAHLRFTEALLKDKNNLGLMIALAKFSSNQGNNLDAIHWLEIARKAYPNELQPAMLLADSFQTIGEAPKALLLAQQIQSLNPGNPAALEMLARLQASNGNYDSALDTYRQLAALRPDSANVQLAIAHAKKGLKDIAGAIAAAEQALHLQPDLMEANVLSVNLLVENKNYSEAIDIARATQARHAHMPVGFLLEGDVLMAQNKTVEAANAYERAFAIRKAGDILIKIHKALAMSGKTAQAETRLNRWLLDHQDDLLVRFYLASDKTRNNNPAQAATQYEAILRIEPNNVMALNDLAWAYHQLHDGRALAYAERAYSLAAQQPAVLDTLGWIVAQQNDITRALPLLTKAAALAPNIAEIQYHLAYASMQAGDKYAARAICERLLSSSANLANRSEVKALLAQL